MAIYSRCYGVLLHVTSLPSPYGVGDLGPAARDFLELLHDARACCWQVLPLYPTKPPHHSPYSTESSFALNPLLVSPDDLAEEGLVEQHVIESARTHPLSWADYDYATVVKQRVLDRAFESHRSEVREVLQDFLARNEHWLGDYALFRVFGDLYGWNWSEWPREYRDRDPGTLERAWSEYSGKIERVLFEQYVLWEQWGRLRREARRAGVYLMGDLPYYVEYSSADVWVCKRLFKLDEHDKPLYVSGVPPDKFSERGQLWNTPVYDWDKLREERYAWWITRSARSLELFDIVRLDHFRGYVAYWEVPAGSPDATRGLWVSTPHEDFFNTMARAFPSLPFVAEDLGYITPDVREVVRRRGFPSTRVLVFAFNGSPRNEHLPHNHHENMVVYTSTHDTNTVLGWFTEEASPSEKEFLNKYMGTEVYEGNVNDVLIRAALSSVARLAILPAQDVLGLGSEARMNRPGKAEGNWLWRLLPGQFSEHHALRLEELAGTYGRT